MSRVSAAEYRALARLRYLIRGFLYAGDAAARRVGLEPQQYQLMLAIRGLPEGLEATVQALAERLALRHNSTVELIDRMEKRGYIARSRSEDDQRCVLVSLLPRGERLLERAAGQRLIELRAEGATLVRAMSAVLGHNDTRRSWRPSSHRDGTRGRQKKTREQKSRTTK